MDSGGCICDRSIRLSLVAVLVVPNEMLTPRPLSRIARHLNWFPVPRVVRVAVAIVGTQARAHFDAVLGSDRQVTLVEQTVEISPQEKSIGHLVGPSFP